MIQIISGRLRGRCLEVPKIGTRPTLGRVREALFNILTHHFFVDFSKTVVLDAFAGSGALGFESMSRGTERLYAFEKEPGIFSLLKKNAEQLKICPKLYQQDFLESSPIGVVDLVFLDPPYRGADVVKVFQKLLLGWVHPGTLIVLEGADFPGLIPNFNCQDQRSYGRCHLSFWRKS